MAARPLIPAESAPADDPPVRQNGGVACDADPRGRADMAARPLIPAESALADDPPVGAWRRRLRRRSIPLGQSRFRESLVEPVLKRRGAAKEASRELQEPDLGEHEEDQ
jgi:hypothetical protein